MLRRLVVSLGSVLMLSLVLLPAAATASTVPVDNFEGRGCCSHHHGQCGCQSNQVVCCDNSLSPTCTC